MPKNNPLNKLIKELEKKPSRSFKVRNSQKIMMEMVYNSLKEDLFQIIEAPTGTGKSLGYLIPSFLILKEESEKIPPSSEEEKSVIEPIIISTATLTLQNQLLEKDIPQALKMTKTSYLKTFVLKGRSNYLCRTRLRDFLRREQDLNEQQKEQIELIQEWSYKTKLGDKSELPFTPDLEIWSHICGDAIICASLRCANGEECFFYHNKKEASQSALIIVNHSLLSHDLAIKSTLGMENEVQAILPHSTRIIIDEAHKFTNNLEDAFSINLTYFSLLKTLNRIDPERKGNLLSLGLFTKPEKIENMKTFIKEIKSSFKESEEYLLNSFDNIPPEDNFLQKASFKLLNQNLWNNPIYQNYIDISSNTLISLKSAIKELEAIRLPFKEEKGSESILAEMNSFILELATFTKNWEYFFQKEIETMIPFARWINKKTRDNGLFSLEFCLYPLEIGGLLANRVYPYLKSLIFTSATLSVENNFSNFTSQLGLDFPSIKEKTEKITLPSIFDPKNVLFMSAIDFPPPEKHQEYMDHLLPTIHQLTQINEGGTLILTTSYDMVQKIHLGLNSFKVDQPIFSQGGKEDNNQILNQFKKKKRSILIGTDSFWEGVDIPGDSLSLVIITKLPFTHPQDPVHYTKKQYLMQIKNLNSFTHYDIPQAILKFKQGFGRLMRRIDDKGAVVCLDSRLNNKPYGKVFIKSLQPHNHEAVKAEDLFDLLDEFQERQFR